MNGAMKSETMLNALVLAKRIGNLLNEIMDLSQQMAEAVDRNDEVAASMLISMRSEPIEKLKIADKALRTLPDSIEDAADGERILGLINGSEALNSAEEPLVKQIASNKRQFEKIAVFERRLNKKITRDKSIFR